jgi:hypothetical protein
MGERGLNCKQTTHLGSFGNYCHHKEMLNPCRKLEVLPILDKCKIYSLQCNIDSRERSNVMNDAHWLSMHAYRSSKIPTSITL